jgi:hypothetical protein
MAALRQPRMTGAGNHYLESNNLSAREVFMILDTFRLDGMER